MAGNPAFSNSPAFTDNAGRAAQFGQQGYGQQAYGAQPYGQAPQAPQFGPQAPQFGQQAFGAQPGLGSPDQLEEQYGRPSAAPHELGRLTYDGVIMKTVATLGVTAIGFVITLGLWLANSGPSPLFAILTFGGAIVGLVLGFVNVFKKEPSRVLVLSYALAQGLFLGGISATLEFGTDGLSGIIFQALLATACVFAATLALYAFRIVRTSPRLNKIFFVAIIGYTLFSLVNFGLMIFGVNQDPWGARSIEIFGIPLGVLLGVLAVVLGAYSLIMDFEGIENGVKRGVPAKYGWSAAFGLTMTIIWLYVEILRLIAILRSNN